MEDGLMALASRYLPMDSISERATLFTLNMLQKPVNQVPDSLLLPYLRRRLSRGIAHEDGVEFVLKIVRELRNQWDRFAPNVRRRFIENFFGHMMLLSKEKHARGIEILGDIPLLMVVSPTMRCNLKCTGCYSAHYDRGDAIDTATFHRVLREAKDLGIHFVVVSGGEPFIRKDLLEIFETHSDMLFLVYTNGTFIYRDKLAPRLAELGNVMPCISVEGFSEETDRRRGKGMFNQIIGAMSALREAGVMFGFSATPMRANNELLVSDEFIEFYANLGCFIGWYFNYMPVGRDPDLSLMPTPEQRKYRMDRIREVRDRYPVNIADFWCDGTLVGGCLSSGRVYFHINAQGGVEPCVFHQFSVDNILDKSLLDALNSPYFRHMRERIKTIDNPLTPCPVSDRPEILREAVETFCPTPSQHGGMKTVTELAAGLDTYSRELRGIMDPIWETMKNNGHKGNGR